MRTTTIRQLGGASRARWALALFGLAAFIALAVPATATAAQFNATVRGKVTNADGEPLEGVKVTIRRAAQDPTRPEEPVEVETDEDGNYNARNVPLGDSFITFEYEGMEMHEERRELRAGPVRIDIAMQPAPVSEEFANAQVANEAYGLGIDAYSTGDYAAAVEQMNVALETLDDIPENAESFAQIYAVLGAAHAQQQDLEAAVEAYTRRIDYAPDDADAHLDLAQALSDAGDAAAAEEHFTAALELDPNDAVTQYNVGATMVNAGDVAGGIARIERAIELRPEYPLAHKELGFAYARQEEYVKAVEALETYLEQAPEAEDAAQVRDFIVALKEMIGE